MESRRCQAGGSGLRPEGRGESRGHGPGRGWRRGGGSSRFGVQLHGGGSGPGGLEAGTRRLRGPLGLALPRPGPWSFDPPCRRDGAASPGPRCRRLRGCRREHPGAWTHYTPSPSPTGLLGGLGGVILKLIWRRTGPGTATNLGRGGRGRGLPRRSPRCAVLTQTGRQRSAFRRRPESRGAGSIACRSG